MMERRRFLVSLTDLPPGLRGEILGVELETFEMHCPPSGRAN
jgi:hypothetical protein